MPIIEESTDIKDITARVAAATGISIIDETEGKVKLTGKIFDDYINRDVKLEATRDNKDGTTETVYVSYEDFDRYMRKLGKKIN